jgi:hypothetical protein
MNALSALGLPSMSESVEDAWTKVGVKAPITLAKPVDIVVDEMPVSQRRPIPWTTTTKTTKSLPDHRRVRSNRGEPVDVSVTVPTDLSQSDHI